MRRGNFGVGFKTERSHEKKRFRWRSRPGNHALRLGKNHSIKIQAGIPQTVYPLAESFWLRIFVKRKTITRNKAINSVTTITIR